MKTINIVSAKEEFVNLLKSTGREGVDFVIEDIEKLGFFSAPASASHHLNQEGGLLLHSLNTCHAGLMLWENLQKLDGSVEKEVKRESVILASLLHDVCKAGIYEKTMKKKKNSIGVWEDCEGYRVTYRDFPMGHGEKSVVQLLLSGLELNDDEILAIRWHMGAFGLNLNSFEDVRNYDAARIKYPLVSIIQSADSIAAGILERTPEDLENI